MKRLLSWILALIMICAVCPAVFAEGDVPTIRVPYMITENPATDKAMVEDAINELLADRGLKFKVEFVLVDYTSWATQIQLMLSDGSIDLFNLHGAASLASLVDNESVADLDALIDQYGSGIKETLGEYLDSAKVNGKLYGTPNLATYSKCTCFILNKDLADECGVDVSAIKDLDTLTEQLKIVKEKRPDLAAITTGKGSSYYADSNVDRLGTGQYACLVLDPEKPDDLTVVNYFATEEFAKMLDYAKIWAESDFFRKDAINAQEANFALMGAGQAFGGFYNSPSPQILIGTFSQLLSFNVDAVTINDTSWVTTSDIGGNVWAVPNLSSHKEEAVQFLNQLYIDADLSNLVCNGIKDVHYKVNDQGTAEYVSEDQNVLTDGWPAGAISNFWPNMMITYPWAPAPADEYEGWLKTNEVAKTSPAFGFTFDSSEVLDQIIACDNVVAKYEYAMMLNVGDRDTMLKNFLDELNAAGVEDIIAEKQRQLDEWAKTK